MPPYNDGWFDDEPHYRRALLTEMRRLARRAKAQWLLIAIITALMTAGMMYKITKKPAKNTAKIVLALVEGAYSSRNTSMPVDQLHDYVVNVLLPAKRLTQLIEELDLYPLRKKQGPEYAISELSESADVDIYENYFLWEYDPSAPRTARIAISVHDVDANRAYETANGMAKIVVATAAEEREKAVQMLRKQTAKAIAETNDRLKQIERDGAAAHLALQEAKKAGVDPAKLAVLELREASTIAALRNGQQQLEIVTLNTTNDSALAASTESGLGLDIQIVDERRPPPAVNHKFQFVIIGFILAFVFAFVSSLFVSSFDGRIHDDEDVTRTGLILVGHVPKFPGDNVGSLSARGIARRRVTSYRPWR